MDKKLLLRLGLLTLIGFPIPTFVVLYYVEGIHPFAIFEFEKCGFFEISTGLVLGVLYALIALQFMKFKVFDQLPNRIEKIVAKMKLSVLECLFLSMCAGVGEELLFRSGMQWYLGPIITSVFFVAIHGYLNPMNWRFSLYGIIVLPFILLISYGFIEWGLWFAISAHFAYDFVLFLVMTRQEPLPNNQFESVDLKDEYTTRNDSRPVDF